MKKFVLFAFISLLFLDGCSRRRIDDEVDPAEMISRNRVSSEFSVKLKGTGVLPHSYQDDMQTYKAVCNGNDRNIGVCYEQAYVFCKDRETKIIDKKEKKHWRRVQHTSASAHGRSLDAVSVSENVHEWKRHVIFSCLENDL